MLDQNTDRMWYVIGAVLVGAAIILIANGTIPEVFASVTDSFNEVSNVATGAIKGDLSNYKDIYAGDGYVEGSRGGVILNQSTDSYSSTFELQTFAENAHGGLVIMPTMDPDGSEKAFIYKPNTTYELNFNLTDLSNSLVSLRFELKNSTFRGSESSLHIAGSEYYPQAFIELESEELTENMPVRLEFTTSDDVSGFAGLFIRPNSERGDVTVRISDLTIQEK